MSLFNKLKNGDTKLKSLRFGADNSFDKPGEGYSNQPYIIKPIPDGQLPNIGIDYILNGGILAASRAIDDVSRLTKMFFDTKTPAGLLFIAKQEALTRLGVKTQAGGQEVYLPTSTLAQAAVTATGLHFYKQGINPIPDINIGGFNLGTGNLNLYSDVVKNNQDPISNRLFQLYDVKLLNNFQVYSGTSISPLSSEILSYNGGPGSILGIGNTGIKFADQRITLGGGIYNINTSTFAVLSISQIQKSSDNINTTRGQASYIPKIQDFRTQLRKIGAPSSIISDTFSYDEANNQTIEGRVHLGNPGRRGDIHDYVYGKIVNGVKVGATDKITAKPLYSSRLVDHEETNDLVKFRIEAIDNNDPGNSIFIHFRAFLDSFSDAFSATWNPTKYIGRGEEFYTYGGFTRAININWTVAAQSKDELIPMYRKLNYLASNLTPDYSDGGYMRGPMMRLTVGGYLYSQPGFITSLTYTVDDASPWEIGINNTAAKSNTNNASGITEISDKSVKELPHIMRVTMAYTPIHEFVPRKQKNKYGINNREVGFTTDENGIQTPISAGDVNEFGKERYIALSQGNHNNYDDVLKPYIKFTPPNDTFNPDNIDPALSDS